MTADSGFRVGIVDDHRSAIWGIERILEDNGRLRLVASAATVDELLHTTSDLAVVILDLRLADGTSPEDNVERFRALGIHVLVYTSGDQPELVRSAARAGVLGVIRKSAEQDEVVDAITSAARGEEVLGMEWAAAIDADPDLERVRLSPQLQRVLTLYANGETSRRIGELMNVQVDTVHEYLKRIRQKYAEAGRPARTKLELFKRAVEDGLLPMHPPHHRS
ncbi:response regulator transcription factor [Gordonia sp. ABSL11-1]|uniref:response regulator transcription factor n=1 Tax=Gordonia sp. ABSL11-1 TaxID=3053924 RepID=UPI002573DE73|nr:response regulator transcription factor [Gordonia sp. ABSL11-1]MDL9946269.1 response regulator transcription factor [Gordonia sp. ABSL11-1]